MESKKLRNQYIKLKLDTVYREKFLQFQLTGLQSYGKQFN